MEQRISIITLGVIDLQKSKAFYDALGWQASSDSEDGIVAYNLPQMTLALYPLEKRAKDINIPLERQRYSSVTLAYNVTSEQVVDGIIEKAVKAGAQLVQKPAKTFWGGYSGHFSDLDGTLWEVAYNPFAPLGPNGEFQWNGVK